MVGVPYGSLGLVGFLIYRGCKKNEAYRKSLPPAPDAKTAS
jgi:hypothetical protein